MTVLNIAAFLYQTNLVSHLNIKKIYFLRGLVLLQPDMAGFHLLRGWADHLLPTEH